MHAEHAIGRLLHGGFTCACRVMAVVILAKQTNTVLTQFLQITGTLEYEDYGWSTITASEWRGSDLLLTVRICSSGSPDRQLCIECRQPRSQRINASARDRMIILTNDHVLLWPHNQEQSELYINGTPADASSLFGALVQTQLSLLGNWYPIGGFLNLAGHSAEILHVGHGMLAKGPASLLESFAKVLDRYDISHSFLPPRTPMWWNGSRWIAEDEMLHVLIIGDSFVVSPSFSETPV